MTSLAMSGDGCALLVNLSSGSIQLWDGIQDPIPPTHPAMKYTGQVQGRFVIRSCFGGTEEGFVVSGSEDSQVGGGGGKQCTWGFGVERVVGVALGYLGCLEFRGKGGGFGIFYFFIFDACIFWGDFILGFRSRGREGGDKKQL